jgi:osmotically-inducible protein OsmY
MTFPMPIHLLQECASMKTDFQIMADVTAELDSDPVINAKSVGIAVNDGVVTLSGHLASFAEKHAVEKAVRRVSGVRGIALELDVKLAPEHRRSDSEIAEAAVAALLWHSLVPDDHVQVEVADGWVTLTGQVDWPYQHASAEQCVRPLVGVRGISNQVQIKPRVRGKDIAGEITAALTRHAQREAGHIDVQVEGSVVTLSGRVDSMAEHDAVVGAAFGTQGVSTVVDQLRVGG